MCRRMLVFLVVIAAVGCSASLRLGDSQFAKPPANCGIVQMGCNVQGADVYLDGQMIGTLTRQSQDVVVPCGTHEISVRKPGYQPYQCRVTIVEGATSKMSANLQPQMGQEQMLQPQGQGTQESTQR